MKEVVSSTYSLEISAETSIGGRAENQDNYGIAETPLGALIVVCDGMGGGPAGDVASMTVCQEMAGFLSSQQESVTRETAMRMAIDHAQKALEAKAERNMTLRGMGTTVVAALVNNESVMIAWAGDSRAYQLRGKRMVYRTTDHSLVAELVKSKVLTEEQARKSPQSNVITRGLGHLKNNLPDVVELGYKAGDRFVLCTDGVWGMLSHKELMMRLTAENTLSNIVTNLDKEIDNMGYAAGGRHDNHTMVIFTTEKKSTKKTPSVARITSVIKSHGKIVGIGMVTVLALVFVLLGLKDCSRKEVKGSIANTGISFGGYFDDIEEPVKVDSVDTVAVVTGDDNLLAYDNRHLPKEKEKKENKEIKRINELLQRTANRLNAMKDTVRGKKQNEAVREKDSLCGQAISYVDELLSDSACNKAEIKELRRFLSGKRNGMTKVDRKVERNGKTVFFPVKDANDKIDSALAKVKNIKESIRKNDEKK